MRRFGGELAVHDAGLRALASSLVPDPRGEWCRLRCYATDDGWCIFEVVQAVAIYPKTFVLAKVLCCVFSRHVSAERNTKLAGLAQQSRPRSVVLRIRSLPREVLLAQLGIGDAVETTAFVHALLLDDPPRAVVTIDDDDDDLGTDIRMHEELKRVKMENSRLRRRSGRLRIKLASIGRGLEMRFQPSVHMSIWMRLSYQLGTTFLQLSVLDLHSIFEL